jgi:aspartyl-tRNA synthetase
VCRLSELKLENAGKELLVRARVHKSTGKGKIGFIVIRQGFLTAQVVSEVSDVIPKAMIKFIGGLSRESIIDVVGTVRAVKEPVKCTQSEVELVASSVHVVSKALSDLPFTIEDAMRPEPTDAEVAEDEAAAAAAAAVSAGVASAVPGGEEASAAASVAPVKRVSRDTRLNYRWIDLRSPANQAIFRISSGVCQLFREYLLAQDFVEIQTPKLLGGASEGGAEVFKTTYFGQPACLAQSPQLYKQMAAACSDLERVFEIGPVFRAENSNTHRHLCEFHGLDMEMSFYEHYYEVLDVFSELFCYIFEGLQTRFAKEIAAVKEQYPHEDFKFCRPALRLTFAEGIALLKENGYPDVDEYGDLSTELERALGRVVKERYGTDFFMLEKYPMTIRPFYTMPDAENPKLSNSYDFFMRGEEILSGAQRIHDPAMLVECAKAKGIPVETLSSYIDSFKHGAFPHGGGGVGLERVVMLFLGLNNIRKTSMFPRDPKRLSP